VKLFELKVADSEEEAFLEAVSKVTKDTGSGGSDWCYWHVG